MSSSEKSAPLKWPDQDWPPGLSPVQAAGKRTVDVIFSTLGLACTFWLIGLLVLAARWDTGLSGLFRQSRIGRWGKPFDVLKIRTMRPIEGIDTTATKDGDPRITRLGAVLRKTKLDELPQLWNVLMGKMSLVGPRPDVAGFADQLEGRDRAILTIRPGITGPASLHFRNEEALLAAQKDPEAWNREVLYPQKVQLNVSYIENYRLWRDFSYLAKTVLNLVH